MSSNQITLRGAAPIILFLVCGLSSFTLGTGSTYTANTKTSSMLWNFNESLELNGLLEEGRLTTYVGGVLYGKIVFNLVDLNAYDLKENVLIHGLKGFDTKNFPQSTLSIEGSKWDGYKTYHTNGILTLKGVSLPVQFILKIINLEKENGNERNYKATIKIHNASYNIETGHSTTTMNLLLKGNWLLN